MALKYFCDCCGDEITQPSAINTAKLATIAVLDPTTGKSDDKFLCSLKCTPKLLKWVEEQQKDNGVVPINKDINLKIAK